MMRSSTSMPASGRVHRAGVAALLALLLVLGANVPAMAAARAWLDRSRVAMGQPVVLSIESDQEIGQPDLEPLRQDFDVIDTSSNRQMEMVNGRISRSVILAITLQPRRTGELTVPALEIQGQRTASLGLRVIDAPAAQPGSSNAYIETEVDDLTPYVQQTVGVTLRLFYAVPLVSGQLDIDPPQGVSLQRVGDDVQTTREVNGRRYNLVERRFLLVPDRSGTLTLPAARFSGRGVGGGGGLFDSMLGMGQRSELNAIGQAQTLHVQAQPANAPQPWLPLSDFRLRYVSAPRELKAGQASTFVVEATARGATRAQLPDLPTPSVDGAQVFAEPAEFTESFDGGTPVVKATRRYSLVPNGAGKLSLPGLKMDWWDVKGDQARTASLPDMQLQVVAGSGNFADATLAQPVTAAEPGAEPGGTPQDSALMPSAPLATGLHNPRLWMLVALGFALLWLLTLGWMFLRPNTRPARPLMRSAPGTPEAASRSHARFGLPDLRRALETGTLDEVGEVLVGMAPMPLRDLDAVVAALADPGQRKAVEALRRARWADGDGTQARSLLRQAFASGPDWGTRAVAKAGQAALPPLYPER